MKTRYLPLNKLPDDWVVMQCDLDHDPAYCIAENPNIGTKSRIYKIPKALAYYLSTHHCSSRKMKKLIESNHKKQIVSAIGLALGINLLGLSMEL